MLRILLASLVLAPTLAFAATQVPLDLDNSSIKWKGSKSFIKDFHTGTVKISNGHVTLEGDNIVGGEFTIDMNSIQNTDLKDGAMQGKLVGHLMSQDFFDVSKHSTAKFVIKNVVKGKNDTYTFEGDLTIRDKTNPQKITTRVKKEGKTLVAKGNTDFDRTKYGVMYNSQGAFPDLVKAGKDKVISDRVDLEFTIKTKDI